jgi:beta-glucosidase-like glycosyl hydrolase
VREPSRFVVLLVAVVALASATVGVVLGAKESDEEQPALPDRAGRPLERTSWLARVVPARRPAHRTGGPATPRSVADLVRRLPVERKVAQLFLLGFEGTDANAEIFRRLRRLDIGGLVLARPNYLDPAQLGAADQSTETGPATVGLDLDQLRDRDLIPFRAAIEAGVPAVLLSHALYPINDFTAPASLTRSIATDLLRRELGFGGVAITDDLADPAIASSYSIPDAAILAMRAGADMLWVSGSPGDQQAAYSALLRAAEGGELPRRRLDEAVRRVLEAKRDYGLIR